MRGRSGWGLAVRADLSGMQRTCVDVNACISGLQRSDPSRVKGFREKPTVAKVHGTQAERSWCSQIF